MGLFAEIPQRGYTQTSPSWWNALQAAGAFLEGLVGAGAGAIAPTDFTFANNEGSATSITGLAFDDTVCLSARVWISVRRSTTTNEIRSEVEIWLNYSVKNSEWQIVDVIDHSLAGSPCGLVFSVTAAGQVKYTSSNLSGSSYSGASIFSATAQDT